MISKELLCEILEFNEHWFVSTYYLEDNIFNITAKSKINEKAIDYLEENIYELAHNCKEWAFNNSIYGIGSTFNEAWIYEIDEDEFINVQFKGKSEPEAIFKATQWILDNKG